MSSKKQRELGQKEGISFCMSFLESHNNSVSQLKEEIQKREAYNIPLEMDMTQLITLTKSLKGKVLHYLIILTCLTLHDEFDFNEEQLRQYSNRLTEKSECLTEDYTTWEETIRILKDECNLDFELTDN